MDDSTVMAVLKNSRKARKQTTCYPCQRRKVKCDRGLPCAVCVARGHSFLCSYGRPAETLKVAPSLRSGAEDNSRSVGQHSPPGAESQLSVLQSQLNRMHQELHEARKRHRKFEEAEDQVRRLQARCKEYEDVHLSLRAGDLSALERINSMTRSDSETSSIAPESCGYSQGASPRDDEGFIFSGDTPQAADVFINASTLYNSKIHPVSSAHPPCEPISRPVTVSEVRRMGPPTEEIPSLQQSQAYFERRGRIPDSTGPRCVPIRPGGGNVSYHFEGVPKCTLQPSASNSLDYGLAMHQMNSRGMPQNQRKPCAAPSENHGKRITTRSSTPTESTSRSLNHQELGGQALQIPSFIENPSAILLNRVVDESSIPSDIAWAQISLFPPMMSSQDMEYMERNYEDYCARIVVEAQQSTMMAE